MCKHKVLLFTFAVTALLVLSTSAWAGTITGYVYRVDGNMLPAADYSGSGSLKGTFTAPGINFSVPEAQGTSNPLKEFLNSGSAAYGVIGGIGDVMSTCTDSVYTTGSGCYSTAITIVGTGYFLSGTEYSITHDDGVLLYIDGFSTPFINSASPTAAALSSAFFPYASGTYSYHLYYMATNGNPEILQSNIPTPEPSSLLLLGSGIAGLAGVMRRKLRRQ